MQKQYGKTEAELETLVEGFSWALAGYTMAQIIKGMRNYILTHNDIPAPSDIIKLIDKQYADENVKISTIEDLLRYKNKGIPLSPRDYDRLKEAGYDCEGA